MSHSTIANDQQTFHVTIRQNVSSCIIKLNWILVLTILLLFCCSNIDSKPTNGEQQIIDNILFNDDLIERAAPRLGRASPRLGRASPRLGRHAGIYIVPHLNHAGRYYIGDDDGINDYPIEFDSLTNEKRAAPRLGRSI